MRYVLLAFLLLAIGCQSVEPKPPTPNRPKPVAESLQGTPLYPLEEPEAVLQKKDSLLAIAFSNFQKDSTNLEAIIWYGRRLAYFYRYPEAIAVYTKGLQHHPEAPELYRHRGHRYLSTRRLDKAIQDFSTAARLAANRPIEIEPDGIPNKLNQPLSTLQFNIWYHLGLAHYIKHDFEEAIDAYKVCMSYSTNPDLLCATTDWLYMAYRRLGKTAEAAALLAVIQPDLEIIENTSYFNRLLMYKGLKAPQELLNLESTDEDAKLDLVTQGYGVGNWHLYNGDTLQAQKVFGQVLATGYWPAFGYLAAEAEIR
ncbi:MAG: hypothetical protein KDC44_02330 [Phaeodactylibacter sp.]|nr:hypothetical protein [Phaeodactylibacter sp.]